MGPVDYLKGDGPNQQVRAAASVSLRFCYLILSIQWNPVNTTTIGPRKFGPINGVVVLTG